MIKRRIYDTIVVNRQSLHTLFDTGAQNSYITRDAVNRAGLSPIKLKKPFPMGLGGEARLLKEQTIIDGTLERNYFTITAFIVDGLGVTHDGKTIDMLFGLAAMEVWGVDLDIKNKRVDLSRFAKEFIEY